MSGPSRDRLYWACQLGGWGLYALVNALLTVSASGAPGALYALLLSALGLALTDAYRAQIQRRGWTSLGILALGPRVLATSVFLSTLTNALVLALRWAFRSPDETFQAVWLFVGLFNWTVMYLAWSLLYFGIHFLERSQRSERERLRMELTAREAELKHLKAQLNPHFLFNCLNSLRALVVEDPPRAQQVVTQLSNLLRYALSSAQAELVPLEREMAVVRDYLALESVRLEERLRVDLDLTPESLHAAVPVMLVQTLVENGIKHGVAQLEGGGTLRVRSWVEDGSLRLEIANPCGRAPVRPPEPRNGEGVGLANAHERLRLLFGARAELELDRSAEDLAVARVRIPLNP